MALRQLLLTRSIAGKAQALEEARAKDAGFLVRKTALETREAELEAALNELTDASTQEEKDAVLAEVDQHEIDSKALETEQAANDTEKQKLTDEIAKLQKDLDDLNARAKTPPAYEPNKNERQAESRMETRVKFFGMNHEERDAFFVREDVKGFLANVRSLAGQKRTATGTEFGIPAVMLDLVRDNINNYSKLISKVRFRPIKGKARQNVAGTIPDAVWTEMIGSLNELDFSFSQLETDGYKVAGYLPVPNSYLEDDDNLSLGAVIIEMLGQAIGRSLDKAILYGTGTKQPVGIVTRLKESTQPAYWGANQGTWTDLRTTNIDATDIDANTGAAFFSPFIGELAKAKPDYSDGRAFWCMNRKTHMDIMAKALDFNASGALVAGVQNTMPVIGGEVVELEFIPDYDVIGGFGSLYLLAEREGASIASSDIPLFLQDQTVFKAVARYDGKPIKGEAFVFVSYDGAAGTDPIFPNDYANTELGVLGVASAAGTASGDTVLTVTGTEASGTTLKYKIGDLSVKRGQAVTGYTALTSGTTQVTCAAGKYITVVELDGNSKVIKSGKVVAVPKA